MDTFRWHDVVLPYWDHPYNNTRNNERAVELAIAERWTEWAGQRWPLRNGLEVGNVLSHYGSTAPREVVDLYEQAPGVRNIDVADIDGTWPWIVSISTVEHVGALDYWDTPVPMASTEAVLHLRDLLDPGGGRMLVTVPLGWNADLDADLAMGAVGVTRQCTLHRHQRDGHPPTWHQADEPVAPLPYAHDRQSAAAVWIGEW